MSAPVVLTRTSFIIVEGDSINDVTLPYGSFNGLLNEIDSFYMPPLGNSFRRPQHANFATSGSIISNVAARMPGEIAAFPFASTYFIQAGINDAHTGVPLATSVAAATTCMNLATGAGMNVLWVGPLCFGEKYPTGANVNDAQIDALDAALAPIVNGHAGCAYISARSLIYAVQEPLINTPGPPGVGSGILCVPAGALGIHPNPTGNKFFAPQTLPALSLT